MAYSAVDSNADRARPATLVARNPAASPSAAGRVLGELAIPARSDPQQANERAPHHVDAAETGCRGHLLEAAIRTFELPPRRFDAQVQHVLGWRRADLAREDPLEVAHAHRHAIGEVFDRQPPVQMLRNPDLQLADR